MGIDLNQGTTEAPDQRSGHPGACERRGSWFGGCRFEPRFDSEPNNSAGLASVRGLSADDLVTVLTKRTYVCDVCVSCGKTIKRGG